jgi:putative serine protease PepD
MKGRWMSRVRILAAALAALAIGVVGAGVGVLLDDDEAPTAATTSAGGTGSAGSAQSVRDADALSVPEIYRRTADGVVEVLVTGAGGTFGEGATPQAQGSGFVYDDEGHVITNQHVVADADQVRVRFADGSSYTADVVGADASTDLAVLDVDAPAGKLQPLDLADSSTLEIGAGVVAIGSPFGLEGTITTGIVSALHRAITAPNGFTIDDAIQTDAAINHGNSGGPLLDLRGDVIGVNAQIRSDGGGNEGVGFAIPSSTVRRIADEIISDGQVEHAYLGISLEPEGEASITSVREGTPAADAGLRVGDVITKLNGRAIASGAELRGQLDRHEPGEAVRLTVRRDGDDLIVTVTLGTRPS